MKLNIDGLAHGAPGRAVASGIFLDYLGVVLGAYCFDIGISTSFFGRDYGSDPRHRVHPSAQLSHPMD